MKKLVQQLNTTDSLTGPARQADVQALWKYVMGFSSDLLSLKNSDVQDLYDEVAALSANIFKRSEQQLLNSTSSPSSGDPKPSTTPVPRPSTLTLKLPTFHGSLLKWKNFWALFSSCLDKETGLTDADKGCLLLEAMVELKARERAEAALAHTRSYDEAIVSLRDYYENNRLLFSHHFDVLTQTEVFKDTVEDLDNLEDKCKASVQGLQSAQGYSTD